MRPRSLAGLALALTTAAAAQEQVHVTLNWLEVTAGSNTPVPNPNSILEPGEAARIAITATVLPGIGATATYTPPPGTGTGTIAGLGAIFVDIWAGAQGSASPSGAGVWTQIAQDPAWMLGGAGSVFNNGAAVIQIQAGQLVLPGMTANPANPIHNIWSGVWTPATYSNRNQLWHIWEAIPASGQPILIRYGTDPSGNPQYIGKFVPGTYGSTTIPIIPAPASLLAVSALFLQRRRRGP